MGNDNLKAGPQFVEYFPTVLDALRALGGSARPAEVIVTVANWSSSIHV